MLVFWLIFGLILLLLSIGIWANLVNFWLIFGLISLSIAIWAKMKTKISIKQIVVALLFIFSFGCLINFIEEYIGYKTPQFKIVSIYEYKYDHEEYWYPIFPSIIIKIKNTGRAPGYEISCYAVAKDSIGKILDTAEGYFGDKIESGEYAETKLYFVNIIPPSDYDSLSYQITYKTPKDIEKSFEQTMKTTTKVKVEETKSKETFINLGKGIRIGEILVTFDSMRITKIYEAEYEKLVPHPNYKFVIINVNGKNVGKRSDNTYSSFSEIQEYNLEVDKGYFYTPVIGYNGITFDLLPEETDSDILIFEILESTMPVKLKASIKGQKFTVNLK